MLFCQAYSIQLPSGMKCAVVAMPGGGCMQQDDPDVLSPSHLDAYPKRKHRPHSNHWCLVLSTSMWSYAYVGPCRRRACSALSWAQVALRQWGVYYVGLCHRESGRVLTADIVECATRMRINMRRNHRFALHGMIWSFFSRLLIYASSHRFTVCRRRLFTVMLWMREDQAQDETCLQPQQHLKCRFSSPVFLYRNINMVYF